MNPDFYFHRAGDRLVVMERTGDLDLVASSDLLEYLHILARTPGNHALLAVSLYYQVRGTVEEGEYVLKLYLGRSKEPVDEYRLSRGDWAARRI